MKIEVWSDVVCPFCYIGKKRLEKALAEAYPEWDGEVEYKSFDLDPDAGQSVGVPLLHYFSKRKEVSIDQASKMMEYVTEKGREENIDFHFEKAIVAGTKDAHILLHAAKPLGLQSALKERFMKAYFIEGLNMNDHSVLSELALEMGMSQSDIDAAWENPQLNEDYRHDLNEARQIGVRGVPFFVFNREFAVSGAQPFEVFTDAINQAKAGDTKIAVINEGDSCDVDGNC